MAVGVLGCRTDPVPIHMGTGGGTTSTTTTTSGAGGSTPSIPEASIVTWNLEQFPKTTETVARVVQHVETLAPTVMAVQEIASEAGFAELDEALADYESLLNDDPEAFIRVGLLYRSDVVTVSDVETLFPDQWLQFPRPPLKARLTVATDPPFDFVIVVVHLKAQLDAESEERRRQACVILSQWLDGQLANGSEQDFMIVGDFNDKITDPPEWNVFTSFLDAPDTFQFLTMPAAQAGDYTYIPFESFIDHILVTTDALAEYGSGETVVLPLDRQEADYRTVISDHRPVIARFRP
jgi:endonuclease/exonuclease/phosphatase family metal-dependent hydrolase